LPDLLPVLETATIDMVDSQPILRATACAGGPVVLEDLGAKLLATIALRSS
jgi:hypothetical protein